MPGLEPLPPPLRGCPQGHKGKSPCADTVYQMCYFSRYLVRTNGSPVTPVCQIAKLSSHLVQRLSAPRGRIWRPPSDGDVPRNDRPPSKTAYFDGNVPFFCRLLSLGTRTPPSSFREREKPAVISRSVHYNGAKTSSLLCERDNSSVLSHSEHKNGPKTNNLLCERDIYATICRSRNIARRRVEQRADIAQRRRRAADRRRTAKEQGSGQTTLYNDRAVDQRKKASTESASERKKRAAPAFGNTVSSTEYATEGQKRAALFLNEIT